MAFLRLARARANLCVAAQGQVTRVRPEGARN